MVFQRKSSFVQINKIKNKGARKSLIILKNGKQEEKRDDVRERNRVREERERWKVMFLEERLRVFGSKGTICFWWKYEYRDDKWNRYLYGKTRLWDRILGTPVGG